ncbi:MAG: hypothetical protein ACTSQI_06070 [Candidatus Helarchaeota archaeon]
MSEGFDYWGLSTLFGDVKIVNLDSFIAGLPKKAAKGTKKAVKGTKKAVKGTKKAVKGTKKAAQFDKYIYGGGKRVKTKGEALQSEIS